MHRNIPDIIWINYSHSLRSFFWIKTSIFQGSILVLNPTLRSTCHHVINTLRLHLHPLLLINLACPSADRWILESGRYIDETLFPLGPFLFIPINSRDFRVNFVEIQVNLIDWIGLLLLIVCVIVQAVIVFILQPVRCLSQRWLLLLQLLVAPSLLYGTFLRRNNRLLRLLNRGEFRSMAPVYAISPGIGCLVAGMHHAAHGFVVGRNLKITIVPLVVLAGQINNHAGRQVPLSIYQWAARDSFAGAHLIRFCDIRQ